MNTVRRLFKNTTILIIANSLQPLLSFYFIVTLTRYLGAYGLGAYSTVFYYQAIFQIFASFGLKNLLTRDIAQYRQQTGKYLTHATLIAAPFTLLNMLLMVIIVWMMKYESLIVWAVVYLSISLIPAALADIGEGVIAGIERLSLIGYTWIIENLLRVIISIWFVWQGYGLVALVWIFVVIKFVKTAFYYWYITKKIAPFEKKIDFSFAWRLTRQVRTFAAIMICVTLYWKIDVILLSKFTSMNDVGLYTAAYRFLFLGMILVDSFINSLFPVISNMFSNARESFEKACRKSLQLLFIITIPIAVSLSLLARPIVLFLYGAKLEQSAEVLKWLIWVIVPYGVSQIFGYAMVASKRQNFDLMVNALGMIVNFALNWIFIHTYGYMGAAYAGLCSIGIYVLLQLPIIVSRIIVVKISRFVADVAKILGAALFMVGFILIFQRQNFIGVSMASFLVYGLALIGFGAFSKSDKDMIIKFLGKSQ